MLRARKLWQRHLAEAEDTRSLSGGFVALLDLIETRLTWFVREADTVRSFAFEMPCYIAAVRARYPDEDILDAIEMLAERCAVGVRDTIMPSSQSQAAAIVVTSDEAEFLLDRRQHLFWLRDHIERAMVAEADPYGWSAWAQRIDRWTFGSLSKQRHLRAADPPEREHR